MDTDLQRLTGNSVLTLEARFSDGDCISVHPGVSVV